MGEGAHFYKIDGKYYIISAWYAGRMRMPAARADRLEGPYEVNHDDQRRRGLRPARRATAARQRQRGRADRRDAGEPARRAARLSMHQGGIVQTPAGEWWGFSMMDCNSVGRLHGAVAGHVEGRLAVLRPARAISARTPRTWVKPKTAVAVSSRRAPYVRNDEFSGPRLANVWQWNHVPDDSAWSLARAARLPAPALAAGARLLDGAQHAHAARRSGRGRTPTAVLDAAGMRDGRRRRPGAARTGRTRGSACAATATGSALRAVRPAHAATRRACRCSGRRACGCAPTATSSTEQARFSYSTDGARFTPFGEPFTHGLPAEDVPGRALRAVPLQRARLAPAATPTSTPMRVARAAPARADAADPRRPHDRAAGGRTRHAARARRARRGSRSSTAGSAASRCAPGRATSRSRRTTDSTSAVSLRAGAPGDGETFQWIETLYGDLVLMSLVDAPLPARRARRPRDERQPRPGARPERRHRAALGRRGHASLNAHSLPRPRMPIRRLLLAAAVALSSAPFR